MQAIDFARAAKAERDAMVLSYAAANGGTAVAEMIARAQLTEAQRADVLMALDQAMTDAFYTFLLALDGSASLGGVQALYRLHGQDGSVISSGDGSLEAAAWEVFQGG